MAERNPRPANVPEKFWDPETGTVRLEDLLASYQELEGRFGVPDVPDGYRIGCDHGLFEPDPDINARLHTAGFTPEQAQLLYDLAAERMIPMLQEMAAQFQSDRELERLVDHFGGEDKWREMSRQLHAWARKNLPPPAVEGLTTTYEGILALHRMMTGNEPPAMRGMGGSGSATEADLQQMMRDPRYWRDRDSGFIARVTEGFRQMYPDGMR
ncbi:MAG TPA: hypothetical protein VEB64_04380 [Azospirillaceae bacterium]|nr:hypothetical protein [Azospirillaceae bacterium]